jgi:hypothetical protein
MKEANKHENEWQSEDEFIKLTGLTTQLMKYRQDNPGLWRVTAAGQTIYNITSWIRLHMDISRRLA